MFRSERTYYVILGLIVLTYILIELLQPKSLDWTESFSSEDKIPYGGYLLHEMLPEVFPGAPIQSNQQPIFEYPDSSRESKNWVFIDIEFGLDQWETNKLLSWVEQGDQVFIAARNYSQAWSDTLEINTNMENPLLSGGSILTDDTARVNFTNPKLRTPEGFPYFSSTTVTHFSDVDSTLKVTVLGINEEQNPNFIRIDFGEGKLYLHSNPTLFTNYFVRDESGAKYATTALSYLPVRATYWDEYYKASRRSDVALRYVVSEEYLSWAWFLSLSGVVLFLIFKAKRKQRIIPHIQPPKNSSIEFAQTIGSLYLENGDHKGIAEKKIRFFLEYIRTNLGLATTDFDESFLKDVSRRSGINLQEIQLIFEHIEQVQNADTISSRELKNLSQQIDQFYKQSER